ncbi:MAG: carbamate kinase [Brevinemataceae bacterium]
MKKIVLALGGNALGESPEEQKTLVKEASKAIGQLVAQNYTVIIVHGNGPQVGMINNAFSIGHKIDTKIAKMPLNECVAMTQSYSGYHLQQALKNELRKLNQTNEVITIITETLVDANDPAFQNPTKPVGPFYTLEESKAMEAQGITMVEDSGRGYREVVASPKPIDIVEKLTISKLLENKTIVICAGGGGIPVIEKNGQLEGINAVIDKDSTAALIAKQVQADYFVLLTAVDKVAINFGKSNQQNLEQITIPEAIQYISEGQFPEGSMLPKINSAIDFVKNSKNIALIASLEKISEALNGCSGTRIVEK